MASIFEDNYGYPDQGYTKTLEQGMSALGMPMADISQFGVLNNPGYTVDQLPQDQVANTSWMLPTIDPANRQNEPNAVNGQKESFSNYNIDPQRYAQRYTTLGTPYTFDTYTGRQMPFFWGSVGEPWMTDAFTSYAYTHLNDPAIKGVPSDMLPDKWKRSQEEQDLANMMTYFNRGFRMPSTASMDPELGADFWGPLYRHRDQRVLGFADGGTATVGKKSKKSGPAAGGFDPEPRARGAQDERWGTGMMDQLLGFKAGVRSGAFDAARANWGDMTAQGQVNAWSWTGLPGMGSPYNSGGNTWLPGYSQLTKELFPQGVGWAPVVNPATAAPLPWDGYRQLGTAVNPEFGAAGAAGARVNGQVTTDRNTLIHTPLSQINTTGGIIGTDPAKGAMPYGAPVMLEDGGHFETDGPIAMVDMHSGQTKAIAGEAGEEDITVTPKGGKEMGGEGMPSMDVPPPAGFEPDFPGATSGWVWSNTFSQWARVVQDPKTGAWTPTGTFKDGKPPTSDRQGSGLPSAQSSIPVAA